MVWWSRLIRVRMYNYVRSVADDVPHAAEIRRASRCRAGWLRACVVQQQQAEALATAAAAAELEAEAVLEEEAQANAEAPAAAVEAEEAADSEVARAAPASAAAGSVAARLAAIATLTARAAELRPSVHEWEPGMAQTVAPRSEAVRRKPSTDPHTPTG